MTSGSIVRALHLSDLHLTDDQAQVDAIVHALGNDITFQWARDQTRVYRPAEPSLPLPTAIDLIIVSGDLTNAATEAEFRMAEAFLAQLCDRFVRGNRECVVVVPGNHDVCWNRSRAAYRDRARFDTWRSECRRPESKFRHSVQDDGTVSFYEIASADSYNGRLAGFSGLVERFYGGRRAFPVGDPAGHYFVFDALAESHNVVVVGFSSVHCNDHLWFRGRIAEGARVRAMTEVEMRFPRARYERIAVWHHGLFAQPGHDDFLDPEDIAALTRYGFCIGMHGHVHTAGHAQLADLRFGLPTVWTGLSYTHAPEPDGLRSFRYNVVTFDFDVRSAAVHVRRTPQPTSERRVQEWEPDCSYGAASRPFFEVALPRADHEPTVGEVVRRNAEKASQRQHMVEIKRRTEPGAARDELEVRIAELDTAPQKLAPGCRVRGLTVIREIGAGGMSEVYEVTDPTGVHLALKKLQDRHQGNVTARKAFRHGVEVLHGLKPAGRRDIVMIGEDFTDAYTMDLVEGTNLQLQVERQSFKRRTLLNRLELFAKLATPLEYVHSQNIYHGDVCPANFIVDNEDGVVLADFDLATLPEVSVVTGSVRAGHFEYMAPEVQKGHPPSVASDVYSLGLVLFYMVVGSAPDLPIGLGSLRDEIGKSFPHGAELADGVIQVVWNCCDARPEHRYTTVSALLSDVRSLVEDHACMPNPTGRWSVVREKEVLSQAQIDRFALIAFGIAGSCFAALLVVAGVLGRPRVVTAVCFLYLASFTTQIVFGAKDIRVYNEARVLARRDQFALLSGFIIAVAVLTYCVATFVSTDDLLPFVLATLLLAGVNAVAFLVGRRTATRPTSYPGPAENAASCVRAFYRSVFLSVRHVLIVSALGGIAWLAYRPEIQHEWIIGLLAAEIVAQEVPMYWWRKRTIWRTTAAPASLAGGR